MYDQLLMLFFISKEDVKGQRYNIEDSQISYYYLCTYLTCHQHHSLLSFNKTVVSFIPSPVFGSLSVYKDHFKYPHLFQISYLMIFYIS